MMLTTKSMYAIIAMIDIAQNMQDKCVSIAQIAERQKLSFAYLEQIFAKLKKFQSFNILY